MLHLISNFPSQILRRQRHCHTQPHSWVYSYAIKQNVHSLLMCSNPLQPTPWAGSDYVPQRGKDISTNHFGIQEKSIRSSWAILSVQVFIVEIIQGGIQLDRHWSHVYAERVELCDGVSINLHTPQSKNQI